jgi:hypothetical protein
VAGGEAGTVQCAHECFLGKGVWRKVSCSNLIWRMESKHRRLRSAPCPPVKRKCTVPLGRVCCIGVMALSRPDAERLIDAKVPVFLRV